MIFLQALNLEPRMGLMIPDVVRSPRVVVHWLVF